MEMVKWIGKFSVLLKRLRDAWMDMLPMSAMSGTRKQYQNLADVTRGNEERQRRNEEMLDPDAPETREGWNVTQVKTHERLLPFNDNLTTLMFIVASDLSEAERRRLTSSLSLLRIRLKQSGQYLWNCSVRRKVGWRILHSE